MKLGKIARRGNFQVDIGALVELLSKNVYSQSDVFVREFVQNSVDAVLRRWKEDPSADPYYTINLGVNESTEEMIFFVQDFGIGMRAQDLEALLGTIGGSSKRGEALRESLGRFGIGILSGFLVADTIELVTRSFSDPEGVTWRWRGNRRGNWTLMPIRGRGALKEPGTRVKIRILPSLSSITVHGIVKALYRYCEHLEVPLRDLVQRKVGGDSSLLQRAMNEPSDENWQHFMSKEFGREHLAVIPFQCAVGEVQGVLGILKQPDYAADAQGGHQRAWLRGILVSKNSRQVAPDWMTFADVAIYARDLEPTASREAFVENDDLRQVREAASQAFHGWIRGVAQSDPALLGQFLSIHRNGIKALAVRETDLLDIVLPYITFQTDRGALTLPQMMERSQRILWAPDTGTFRRLGSAATSQGVPVVNAHYTWDKELLEQSASRFPGLMLEMLEPSRLWAGAASLAERGKGELHQMTSLAEQLLSDLDVQVFALELQPPSMPCLLYPSLSLLGEGEDDPLARLLADASGNARRGPLLVLNATNPLIRMLSRRGTEEQEPWVRLLLAQARLVVAREPGEEDWQQWSMIMERFLPAGEE